MAIIYNPNKKIFTLHTAHTTYKMQVDPLGYLLHLYYGEKTNSSTDNIQIDKTETFSSCHAPPDHIACNRVYQNCQYDRYQSDQ